ncbi:MAG: glucose dehydrogenase [Acidiferrobacteraceae bacterium]|nr:glucose dehydrogenase [Acidiferrobacteraceae bacterium]|tara:strand:+ start:13048 stop:14745 length:1698 start_codon:yes stop_codon:yes gene_type:complete
MYDYLIIGAGSAGSILAHRLSSDPSITVALIEAGPDLPPEKTPEIIWDSHAGLAYFDPRFHWNQLRVYNVSPQLDPNSKPSRYEQARVVGGGSSINGQFAVRGLVSDYDEWSDYAVQGWSYADLLPFFKKTERDLDFGGSEHGDAGKIPVRRIFQHEWGHYSRAILKAAIREGFNFYEDLNGTDYDGCFPMPMTNQYGRRVSSSTAYLDAATRRRTNLEIFTDSYVSKLLIEGRRAIGVEILGSQKLTVLHSSEVIISAGALHSPALLMRSGIGPGEHLNSHDISIVADLPGVGSNLMEHPSISLAAHLKGDARMPVHQRRHSSFVTRFSSKVDDCANGDMFLMPMNSAGWHPLGKSLGTLLGIVNKSYSRGTVRLRSQDASVEPLVDLNMLGDQRDLTRLVEVFQLMTRIMRSSDVQKVTTMWFPAGYNDEVRSLMIPNVSNWLKTAAARTLLDASSVSRRAMHRFKFSRGIDLKRMEQDLDYIADWVKSTVWPGWHVCGTCRIGKGNDKYAVVDEKCKVHGIQGLRVIDASVMPTIPSANTNLPTMAIAEKISSSILHDQDPR